MTRVPVDEEDSTLWFWFKWIVVTAVALLFCAFLIAAASGSLNNLWTKGIRSNIGYVQSRNQHAREMITIFYGSTNEGQQKAALRDICSTSSEIPQDQVDRDVKEFLDGHPCR